MPLSLPYFKFNVSDWILSEKIEAMNGSQVGAYIMLLAHCWASGNCTLPRDQSTLKIKARWQGTDEDFTRVLECFVPARGGRLTNGRLQREWMEACHRTDERRQSGLKGAEKRWAEKPARQKPEKAPPVDWLLTIRANPAYKHIHIDTELSKMDAWLSTKPGRKKTKSFVVNWLNKIEAPLTNGHGKPKPPPFPPKTDPIARGQWRTAYGDPAQYGYE